MPPPTNCRRVPVRTLFWMMLLRMVGELKTKMPPPAVTTGAFGSCPPPPVSVKPSRTVAGVCPTEKVTTEHLVPVLFAQKELSVHGLPEELMVVTAAPP